MVIKFDSETISLFLLFIKTKCYILKQCLQNNDLIKKMSRARQQKNAMHAFHNKKRNSSKCFYELYAICTIYNANKCIGNNFTRQKV